MKVYFVKLNQPRYFIITLELYCFYGDGIHQSQLLHFQLNLEEFFFVVSDVFGLDKPKKTSDLPVQEGILHPSLVFQNFRGTKSLLNSILCICDVMMEDRRIRPSIHPSSVRKSCYNQTPVCPVSCLLCCEVRRATWRNLYPFGRQLDFPEINIIGND